jgi:hypothetical protein
LDGVRPPSRDREFRSKADIAHRPAKVREVQILLKNSLFHFGAQIELSASVALTMFRMRGAASRV